MQDLSKTVVAKVLGSRRLRAYSEILPANEMSSVMPH